MMILRWLQSNWKEWILNVWQIIGIYRDPNEDILMNERLASRYLHSRNLTKRSFMGGDLNLRQADWKLNAEKASGF